MKETKSKAHDTELAKVLQALQKSGLGPNSDKCQFRVYPPKFPLPSIDTAANARAI